jgi:hypothetical protein
MAIGTGQISTNAINQRLFHRNRRYFINVNAVDRSIVFFVLLLGLQNRERHFCHCFKLFRIKPTASVIITML